MTIKVAVIDDGVSTETFSDLDFCLEIDARLKVQACNKSIARDSHGTRCAMIIRKYAPSAQIGSIKILDPDTGSGFVEKLIPALDWCLKNDVRLINLSLGTTHAKDYPLIKRAIEKYKDHMAIVAAVCNRNAVSYPASLSEVIGVCCHPELQNDSYFNNPSPDFVGIDFYASAKHKIGLDTDFANSFAAPLITAKVFSIMQKTGLCNTKTISEKLCKQSSCPQLSPPPGRVDGFEIPRIVILTKNKVEIAARVAELFMQQDYNTLFLSSKQCEAQIPVFTIPDARFDEAAINYFLKRIVADVIIIELSAEDIDNKSLCFDCDLLFNGTDLVNTCALVHYEKELKIDEHKIDVANAICQTTFELLV